MKITKMLLLFCFFLTNYAMAQTHEAHTHGEARMWIVFEGTQLSVELETPAANVLGFEHIPRGDTERNQLERAVNTLSNPELLFSISPLCTLKEKNVDAPFSMNGFERFKRELNAEEYKHEAHEHELNDHKSNEDDDHHKDFRLHYEWLCPNTKSLRIKLNIFDAFAGFDKMRTQWIAFDKQISSVLTKANSIVEISQ